MISIEISGIGLALACAFLKELGFIKYGKPGVHLKDIIKALMIIEPFEKSVIKLDNATLRVIDRKAKVNNITPYVVDKAFWLIRCGNFNVIGKSIGR